jgi:hypothetical protein
MFENMGSTFSEEYITNPKIHEAQQFLKNLLYISVA